MAVSTASAYAGECKGKAAKGKAVAVKAESGCDKACDKPCGCKHAKTASHKAHDNPHGKGAKTAGHKAHDMPCDGPCPCKGGKTASMHSGCPIAKRVHAVRASMPAMQYRVGKEMVGCSKRAASMAEETGKPMQYLVGEETFASKAEAVVKLTALLEGEAESLQSVQFVVNGETHHCPTSAKTVAEKSHTAVAYRVGGFDFSSEEDAEKALASIHEALANVSVAYDVGGESYHCGQTAAAKSEETGKKITYVIGDEETPCKKSAKLMLTETKVRTIVETAAAAFQASSS